MQIAGMLLGCILLGAGPTSGHPVRSAEIVTEAMLLPVGSTIAGQPLTLVAALGSTGDRGQQLRVVRAYWRLAQAIAEYRFCADHARTLGQIRTGSRGDAMVRLAEATAAAQLREAELNAMRFQYELAEFARLPTGSPLPLPGDRRSGRRGPGRRRRLGGRHRESPIRQGGRGRRRRVQPGTVAPATGVHARRVRL